MSKYLTVSKLIELSPKGPFICYFIDDSDPKSLFYNRKIIKVALKFVNIPLYRIKWNFWIKDPLCIKLQKYDLFYVMNSAIYNPIFFPRSNYIHQYFEKVSKLIEERQIRKAETDTVMNNIKYVNIPKIVIGQESRQFYPETVKISSPLSLSSFNLMENHSKMAFVEKEKLNPIKIDRDSVKKYTNLFHSVDSFNNIPKIIYMPKNCSRILEIDNSEILTQKNIKGSNKRKLKPPEKIIKILKTDIHLYPQFQKLLTNT